MPTLGDIVSPALEAAVLQLVAGQRQNMGIKMIVTIKVLDQAADVKHQSQMSIDALMLTIAAESRQEMAKSLGPEWTIGAVTFFGQEVLDALKARRPSDDVMGSVMSLAMAVWVFDSIYGGLSAELFLESDLDFIILPDGAVKYDRRHRHGVG